MTYKEFFGENSKTATMNIMFLMDFEIEKFNFVHIDCQKLAIICVFVLTACQP